MDAKANFGCKHCKHCKRKRAKEAKEARERRELLKRINEAKIKENSDAQPGILRDSSYRRSRPCDDGVFEIAGRIRDSTHICDPILGIMYIDEEDWGKSADEKEKKVDIKNVSVIKHDCTPIITKAELIIDNHLIESYDNTLTQKPVKRIDSRLIHTKKGHRQYVWIPLHFGALEKPFPVMHANWVQIKLTIQSPGCRITLTDIYKRNDIRGSI